MVSDRVSFQAVSIGPNKVMAIGGFSGHTTSLQGTDGIVLSSTELFIIP